MRRLAATAGCALLWAGCKDPEVAAAEAKVKVAEQRMLDGRNALAAGDFDKAAADFKAAASIEPEDPKPVLLLADAERQAGNDTAAILALKQASELSKASPSPAIKRELSELYRRNGNIPQAVKVLCDLRDTSGLTDDDVLTLARLQGQAGDFDGAYETLKRIQVHRPDDPRAKVLEAEILLLAGDELLAAKLMDRLVNEKNLPQARMLRARYFLNAGYPDSALQDLAGIHGDAAQSPEVVEIKARALTQLKRYDEAEEALRTLLQNDPKNADLLAELAETKLDLGQPADAQALVDQALALRPRFPRALYVRARALETKGELAEAAENYEYARRSDPSFGPALSRMWRIYQHRGEKAQAMEALERLFLLNQATIEEKVALAQMYAETRINVERGKKLVEEALRRDPENPHYREVRAALSKTVGGSSGGSGVGIIIMKGRH